MITRKKLLKKLLSRNLQAIRMESGARVVASMKKRMVMKTM